MSLPRLRPFHDAAHTAQMAADAAITAAEAAPGRSLWQDAWRRLRKNHAAMASLVVLVAMIVGAILIPLVSPYTYYTPQWDMLNHWPTLAGFHVFGTDALGRDELVRVMWGMRVSLMIGLVAAVVSLAIGVLWGATAGYLGGWVDALMMRIVDILYAVPFIPFVIVLLVLFGRDLILIFVAIGAVSWLDIARIVRGQALGLAKREFVEAARASGVGSFAIIRRHLVPNLIGIVIIYITLTIPSLILFEAFLSFLGLGVQAPMASLGSLVSDGVADMHSHPYLLIAPSVFLAAVVYCFNYLGDGLRDALDPKDRR